MTRKYKILNASELPQLETLGFVAKSAMNADGTLILCEFAETPDGSYLTHEKAIEILNSPDWRYPDVI